MFSFTSSFTSRKELKFIDKGNKFLIITVMHLWGIYAVLALLLFCIVFFRMEKIRHDRNVRLIPIRIWVNGTRGKSSVARLIAAGLRAGGKKVIGKTTGTKPRFILRNDFEVPVQRLGVANIREQIKVFRMAKREKPDAIVLECMALRPDLQWTESRKLVQPTAVVITNVRADHLDVMGPTLNDMARTFINDVPNGCPVFTAEKEIFNHLEDEITNKDIKIKVSNDQTIPDKMMSGFSYIEHKENVALALDVCAYCGVDRNPAIKGMHEANPDAGVLRKFELNLMGKKTTLVYAMAANDPDSTYLIWQTISKDFSEIDVLVNCRNDRIDRSIQMAELITGRIKADKFIFTGSGTEIIRRHMPKTVDKSRILDLGGKEPNMVYEKLAKFISNNSLIYAVGNTVGYGEAMIAELTKHQG